MYVLEEKKMNVIIIGNVVYNRRSDMGLNNERYTHQAPEVLIKFDKNFLYPISFNSFHIRILNEQLTETRDLQCIETNPKLQYKWNTVSLGVNCNYDCFYLLIDVHIFHPIRS